MGSLSDIRSCPKISSDERNKHIVVNMVAAALTISGVSVVLALIPGLLVITDLAMSRLRNLLDLYDET